MWLRRKPRSSGAGLAGSSHSAADTISSEPVSSRSPPMWSTGRWNSAFTAPADPGSARGIAVKALMAGISFR
jgi:hypothetical protein